MSPNVPRSSQGARPGYFAEVTLALIDIRDTWASGRLSMRNGEKFSLAHLYFRAARLVHVTGVTGVADDKHGGEAVLQDLLTWSKGSVRFDATALIEYDDITWQQARIFERWVSFLEMRGRLLGIPEQQVQRLAHSLTITLPAEPVALPEQIVYHEDYSDATMTRQMQRFGSNVRDMSHRTQELAQRVAKSAYEKAQLTMKQVAIRAEDAIHAAQAASSLTKEKEQREQRIIQPTQKTVQAKEEQISSREMPSLRMRKAEL